MNTSLLNTIKHLLHRLVWRRAACVCLSALVYLSATKAQAGKSEEYEEYALKAGYLYNFITFTEWPAALPATLTLCIYGQDPFGTALDSLQNKTVGNRTLAIKRLSSADEVNSCQVVFVSREAINNVVRLQQAIGAQPVLLIADNPGAAAAGVAINLLTDGERISFEINLKAAQQQGLNLSYRLLRLAQEVLK
jgi:hypothetical protein